jgi:S1-C subfamily serine protease
MELQNKAHTCPKAKLSKAGIDQPMENTAHSLPESPRQAPNPRLHQPRWILLLILIALPSMLLADRGQEIYTANSRRVVVLYVKSESGRFIASGSGFWIAGRRIVTNAHVASRGRVYVELGDVRIACTLERADQLNDLAILTIDTDVEADAVTLAVQDPKPGESIYVISNPEGLDKSISQGVVSAVRALKNRRLLQISAPISHGSSGGPVFNAAGEVVGVAVGAFEEGQNLNFAIPITALKDLLDPSARSATDPSDLLAQVKTLREQQNGTEYSADAGSAYQSLEEKADRLTRLILQNPRTNPEILLAIAEENEFLRPDLAIAAAERLLVMKPSSDAQLRLATALMMKWTWEQKKDAKLLDRAEKAASEALLLARRPTPQMYYRLGDIYEDKGNLALAEKFFRLGVGATPENNEDTWPESSIRGLIRVADARNDLGQVRVWFSKLAGTSDITFSDWRSQGSRLERYGAWAESGQAYQNAAQLGKHYEDWCSSAGSFWIAGVKDSALMTARQCLAESELKNNADKRRETTHVIIADILNERGVYSEALAHARDAAAINSKNDWAFYAMARALLGLRRFTEAVSPAEQAIRLSDGKYAMMHFALGSAHFELENYELSRQSYEKAAELDPKDSASVYNVALCYQRLKYWRDAAKWYEEYLRRKPDAPDRQDILERIRLLRQ